MMKFFPTASFHSHFLTPLGWAACLCLSIGTARGQQEFELKNGLKIPAESVKATGNGFTATITRGTAVQTLNFTAKDVVRAKLREPKELIDARTLVANQKPKVALERLDKVEATLLPLRSIPDNWWVRSALTRMDALAESGKSKEALAIATSESVAALSSEDAELLKNFETILTPPTAAPDEKIEALKKLDKSLTDSWLAARLWLEIGNTLANQGKVEDALKAWMRVPVFFPAEKDLAVRGTILAARGLQQINAPKDGLKILEDYLSDHLTTPYKQAINAERSKLDPKSEIEKAPEAPEADATPAATAETDAAPEAPAEATPEKTEAKPEN